MYSADAPIFPQREAKNHPKERHRDRALYRVAAWPNGWLAVWLLLILGADHRYRGAFQNTPLHNAVRWGSPLSQRILRRFGAEE
ncbi:MAG: hypothetical protein HY398_02685 [Candidatus Doudnabacteria bacterium]|nr:hypothetical protein [Candidatus Doudnabacteria bacterium]